MCLVGRTCPFLRMVIRQASITCWCLRFSKIFSFVEYKRSSSDIAPQQILRTGCFLTETEKEPITVQAERILDCLAEETSTIKSPDCNFLIPCASPRIEWKVFAMRKGNVFLNDVFELLSIRSTMKQRVKQGVCAICFSPHRRESNVIFIHSKKRQIQILDTPPTTEANKGMHNCAPVLSRVYTLTRQSYVSLHP